MVEISYETKNIIHQGQKMSVVSSIHNLKKNSENIYPISALASTKQWPNQNT